MIERITFSRDMRGNEYWDTHTLRITIFPKRKFRNVMLLGVHCLVWCAAEAALLFRLTRVTLDSVPKIRLLASVVLAFVAAIAALKFFWCMCGREELLINRRLLRVCRAAGPLGFERDFLFDKNSSVVPAHVKMETCRKGSLAFSYDGRTHHIAKGLDVAEARYLLYAIQQWTA